MTLPGIAGMILTIGVAADANVVIFERIKEEVRLGKTVRAAISSGYTKGFRTIVDANVVTLITAGVLFMAGTGSVKGFAFTLAVGVLVSMFTAVLATRAMLGVLSRLPLVQQRRAAWAPPGRRCAGAPTSPGRTNLWFAISGVVVLIAAWARSRPRASTSASTSRAARAIEATFVQARDAASRSSTCSRTSTATCARTPSSRAAAIRDAPAQGDKFRRFEIKAPAKALAPTAINKVEPRSTDSSASPSTRPTTRSSSTRNPSRRRSAARSCIGALYAVIFSMFLIVAYLTFRFEFKYALPTIVALFHDVIITIGVYSLTGRVVTAATVAAVLTVLGYSLYDTIIVFDRVRENTPLLRKNSFAQIVNVSIWETLTRSLNTSLITLFPIAHAARSSAARRSRTSRSRC